MPTSSGIPDDQLARARLAWISAGQPALSAPRRALPEEPTRSEPGLAAPVADDAASSALGEPAPDPGAALRALPTAGLGILEQALRRRYVVAVLALLLVGLGITMAVLSQSSASQVPLATPPGVERQAPPPAPSTPTPEPVALRVHVLGAVASPGVVSVPEGAIVADALTAAGGLLPDADPAQLNLAARLADGQQVVVGTRERPQGDVRGQPSQPGDGGAETTGKVNLNTASQAQLEELPGVGPVLAGEIIAWRDGNGGFGSVADLQEVSGIGPKTYETLEPLVTV